MNDKIKNTCNIIRDEYNKLDAFGKKRMSQRLINLFGSPIRNGFVRHHWSYAFDNIFDTILIRFGVLSNRG